MSSLIGQVVTATKDKTAVVQIEHFAIHSKYKKRMARTKRFLVHDEIGLKTGDTVRFEEVKPISKLKRWKAVEVVK
jgi:small subunit ribosomal protein S17